MTAIDWAVGVGLPLALLAAALLTKYGGLIIREWLEDFDRWRSSVCALSPAKRVAAIFAVIGAVGGAASSAMAFLNDSHDLYSNYFGSSDSSLGPQITFDFSTTTAQLECRDQPGWLLRPFQDAKTDWLDNPGGSPNPKGDALLRDTVASVIGKIEGEQHLNHHTVAFLLIGASDQKKLRGEAALRFKSNVELARARAEYVRSLIERDWAYGALLTVIVMPRGAEFVGEGLPPHAEDADRSVRLCVFWSDRAA